jgi:glycosyltransferase involved in cell wall biosynthesis
VAVSEGVRLAVIDEYRLPADRVQTIYNILDLDRLDRLAGAGEPDCDGSRFQIVAAGRLQFAKGYRYLLEALDELVNRRGRRQLLLHILGEGPLEAELKEFVAAHRLEQHVRFAAHVPNPYPYFRRAQLFCLPSLYEGMPNALIEALACRVQVLATDCPNGPREILAGGKHGRLVPPADAMALADAIDAVLLDHMQGRGLVTDARRHVEETFSVSAGMARLESLLLSAARGS